MPVFHIQQRQLQRSAKGALSLLLFAFFLLDISQATLAQSTHRILYFNLLGGVSPWVHSVIKETKTELESLTGAHVEFHIENASRTDVKSPENRKSLKAILETRYGNRFDYIVDFGLHKHVQVLVEALPGVPIVIPVFESSQMSLTESVPDNVYRRIVTLRPVKTAELILDLLPDTRKIVVIAGAGDIDKLLSFRARQQMGEKYKAATVEYWLEQSDSELVKRVSELQPDTAILFLSHNLDRFGMAYSGGDIIRKIDESSPSPIFSVGDISLGTGVVGGYLESSVLVAQSLAKTLYQIAYKKPPEKTVDVGDYGSYQFDWNQLRRWNITEDLLPAGSIVINKPGSIFERFSWLSALSFTTLALMAFALAAMFLLMKQRRKIQNQISQNNERLSQISENLSDIVWLWEADGSEKGTILYVNNAYEKIFQKDREDILNDSADWLSSVHPDDIDKVRQANKAFITDRAGYNVEFRILQKNGTIRHLTGRAEKTIKGRKKDYRVAGVLRDVTDMKLEQAEREAVQLQLQLLLNTVPDLVWLKDTEGNYLSCNPMFSKFYGAPVSKIIGKTDFDFIDHEIAETFRSGDQDAILANKSITVDEHVPDKATNSYITLETTKTPLFDANQKLLGVLGIARDISQRKKQEAELLYSENRFRDFAETAADWFWEMDDRLCFTYIAGRAHEVMGIRSDDYLGKSRRELYSHCSDFKEPNWEQHFLILEQRLSFSNFEIDWINADGLEVSIEISGKPIFSESDDFMGYRGVGRDISETINVSRQLQEQAEFLGLLITSLPNQIYWKNRKFEFLGCNKAFSDALGLSRTEDIAGKRYSDLVNYQEGIESAQHWDKIVMDSGKPLLDWEEPYYTVKGEKRFVLTSKSPVKNEQDEVVGLLGISTDITDRKIAEEALRRSQKMEAIGQMAGGIAHDFNNILGVVLGNIDLLERQHTFAPNVLEKLEAIGKSALRASHLTNQLLGFSRQNHDSLQITNLNDEIINMQGLISRSLTPQVEVQTHLDENLWPAAIDTGEFQDVLLNLLLNARDAMNGKGELRITTRNKTILDKDLIQRPDIVTGDYLELAITDSGCGIQSDKIEKIFEPFYTTKPTGQGTGLGLAMVFGFIKRSGGFIEVKSELNEGTSFLLYLPRSSEALTVTSTDNPEDEQLPGGSESVLIVDDEIYLLELAKESLEMMGYNPITTESPVEALEILQKNPEIKLLFSDIVMPGGISGYQLAKDATQARPDLKVLLTSGYSEKQTHSGGNPAEELTLLKKPYSIEELAHSVRETLDS